MNDPRYIEDIFLKFIDTMRYENLYMQPHDRSAAVSFYTKINEGQALTKKQADYVLKILNKYRNVLKPVYDYENMLELPQWRNPFRVIDTSRKVWIDKNFHGSPVVCLKFPFNLKDDFEKEFVTSENSRGGGIWNPQKKVREMQLYESNLIQIQTFCRQHDFEFDSSFISAVESMEEIWNNENKFLPISIISNGTVVLQNANETTIEYFEGHKTGKISNDLLLAKNMGYLYSGKPKSFIEKIASSPTNKFWVKTMEEFLTLCYQTDGKVCILLERTSDGLDWIKQLAQNIDNLGYERSDFRICFRTSNKEDPEFNEWVSKNKFGGKIDSAKFLIFQHKPAKWLFKKENDVIIVASNDLIPSLNNVSRSLFKHHPCVINVGEFKPVKNKEDIIEL